jgi:hypothetical protein
MFNASDVCDGIAKGIQEQGMPEMERRTGLTAESLARIACGAKVRRGTLLAAAAGLGLVVNGPAAISLTPLPTA